jgi:hypothetical protein
MLPLLAGEAGGAAAGIASVQARLVPHDAAAEITYSIAPAGFTGTAAVTLLVRREPLAASGRPTGAVTVLRATVTAEAPSGVVRDSGLPRNETFRYVATVVTGGREFEIPAGELTVPPLFSWDRLRTLCVLLLFGGLFVVFARRGRTRPVYLRRIAGIDAIEEAIGRATEMGKPVLYVPGVEDQTDIQTLASLVILGEVARTSAEYGVRLLVPARYPVVMTMAQEIVQEAFAAASRPEAYVEEDIRYLSDEQFAYAAAVDGIMVRDRPAANLFLGTFYAESLILAETGFAGGAIQVAGTAKVAQLPFFIVACDYTMIAEEFFAASAYLSGNPQAVAGVKAADWLKVALILYVAGGLGLAVLGHGAAPILEYWRSPQALFLQGR